MAHQSLIIVSPAGIASQIPWEIFLEGELLQLAINTKPSGDRLELFPKEGGYRISDLDELINWGTLMPAHSKKKLAVINDAHLLNVESQNKLLKILEEPAATTQIVLVTNNEYQLLDTVRSRCVVRYLNTINNGSSDSLELVDRFANGNLGKRFDLAQQIAKNEQGNIICEKILDNFIEKSQKEGAAIKPESLLQLVNLYRKNKNNIQLTLECLAIMLE